MEKFQWKISHALHSKIFQILVVEKTHNQQSEKVPKPEIELGLSYCASTFYQLSHLERYPSVTSHYHTLFTATTAEFFLQKNFQELYGFIQIYRYYIFYSFVFAPESWLTKKIFHVLNI